MSKNNFIIRNLFWAAGISVLFFGLTSCERDIDIDIPDSESQIVVEGYIYKDTNAYLFLTRSSPFFAELDSSKMREFIVRGATITISDGFTTDTMVEFEYPQYFLHFYYSPNIKGVTGRSYSLRIETNGEVLTASTYLPPPVPLDSVWWKPDGNLDSLGFAWAHLTDPDTVGNYYRWFAKRINKYTYGENAGEQKDADFIAPLGSTFDDRFINGKSFEFPYNRGQQPNSDKEDDDFMTEGGYYKRGDTIVVRWCTYDQANYKFWRDAESQYSSNGNPFSNPTPITGNIQGGLGIFGGYGVSYDTIIAQ